MQPILDLGPTDGIPHLPAPHGNHAPMSIRERVNAFAQVLLAGIGEVFHFLQTTVFRLIRYFFPVEIDPPRNDFPVENDDNDEVILNAADDNGEDILNEDNDEVIPNVHQLARTTLLHNECLLPQTPPASPRALTTPLMPTVVRLEQPPAPPPAVENSPYRQDILQILDTPHLIEGDGLKARLLGLPGQDTQALILNCLGTLLGLHIEKQGLSRMDRRQQQIRTEIAAQEARISELLSESGLQLTLTENGTESTDLQLFKVIWEYALTYQANQELEARKALIRVHRPQQRLENLTPPQLEELYMSCKVESNLCEEVARKFALFIANAKLPPEIASALRVEVKYDGHSVEAPFTISACNEDLLLGYSLSSLLRTTRLRTHAWEGETRFTLSLEEMQEIQAHFAKLKDWHADFEQIFADLLDTDSPENYISVASKKLSEITRDLRDEEMRGNEGAPRIAYRMRGRLEALERSTPGIRCLLFDQLSINLTDHPERDFIKEKITSFYEKARLFGFNGKPKKFMKDDDYRTNLNWTQMMAIAPQLNRLLTFQRRLTAFTGERTLYQALQWFVNLEMNELESFHAMIQSSITEALAGMVTRDRVPKALALRGNLSTMDGLQDAGDQLFLTQLNTLTIAGHPSRAPVPELTRAHRNALYQAYPPELGAKELEYPNTHDAYPNVKVLFWHLKNDVLIQQMVHTYPDLATSIEALETEFLRRISDYSTLREESLYFSRKSIRETVGYFETYVGKVIHREALKITEASIRLSLNQLIGIANAETAGSCAMGLFGRINGLLIMLMASVGEDVADWLRQQQKGMLLEAFQETCRGNAQSSHDTLYYGEADAFYGISSGQPSGIAFSALSPQAQSIIGEYVARYTPAFVYATVFEFIVNKFTVLNRENKTEEIYRLFESLGFTESRETLLEKYGARGLTGWQIAYIMEDLRHRLGTFLMTNGYLLDRATVQVTEVPRPRAPRRFETAQETLNVDTGAGQNTRTTTNVQTGGG